VPQSINPAVLPADTLQWYQSAADSSISHAPYYQPFNVQIDSLQFGGAFMSGSSGMSHYDSLLIKIESAPNYLTHTPKPAMVDPKPALPGEGGWIFFFLLAGFILLALLKYYYDKRLRQVISAVFSRSAAHLLVREGGIIRNQAFIPLLAIYFLSISILIYEVMNFFMPDTGSLVRQFALYSQIFLAYLLFNLVKILFIRFGGIVFRNSDTAKEYIQTIFLYNLFSGILLLPLLVLITYTYKDIFIYITLAIIVLIFIGRFIRGFFIGLSESKFSLFHLFLYLCTLEILPIAVIAKFVIAGLSS
jgi:hypothetical protein